MTTVMTVTAGVDRVTLGNFAAASLSVGLPGPGRGPGHAVTVSGPPQ